MMSSSLDNAPELRAWIAALHKERDALVQDALKLRDENARLRDALRGLVDGASKIHCHYCHGSGNPYCLYGEDFIREARPVQHAPDCPITKARELLK
jgi:hypothetical protein